MEPNVDFIWQWEGIIAFGPGFPGTKHPGNPGIGKFTRDQNPGTETACPGTGPG
jgi:hypothetical protein